VRFDFFALFGEKKRPKSVLFGKKVVPLHHFLE